MNITACRFPVAVRFLGLAAFALMLFGFGAASATAQGAIADYQRTGYGGWPWPKDGPVHPRTAPRFALHADGHREDAPAKAEA